MIVGHGDIASVLKDRENFIFFASGVSNSQCKDVKQFEREGHLLSRFYGTVFHLVYFSTISVFDKETPYTAHKELMELVVKSNFDSYTIIRLGNIDWGTNPNTFINYLKAHPEAERRDEYKYMISKEQLLFITNNLPRFGRNEISIFGEMKKVRDCL